MFRLHVDHLANPDRDVWAVRQAGKYRTVHEVSIYGVTLRAVFRGYTASQPRAYLEGVGIVTIATITHRGRPTRHAAIV